MATKHVTRPRRTPRGSSSRPRTPVTLDRVKILRHFGKVEARPVDPVMVARALDLERLDPDHDQAPTDRAAFLLRGVASTLDALGAPMLAPDQGRDDQELGEALWFLGKVIRRGVGLIFAEHPAENAKASAYQIIRPGRRR